MPALALAPMPRKTTPKPAPLPSPEEFRTALKTWRENAGLSRKAASEILGVGESTINAWESGTRKASAMAIRAIAPLLQ